MKSFNDFEIKLLRGINSFRKEGIISLKNVLEKVFFNPENEKALIIQLREQYAIYFVTNKIYNNPITQKEAIVQFSQLLALLEFLNTRGVISIFRKQHSVKEPMYFLSSIFSEPKLEKDKILLNNDGLYTDKPEEIKNAKGEIIYKGIQFNDSHFIIKNLIGNIVISDKIQHILDEIDSKKETTPFFRRQNMLPIGLGLLLASILFFIQYQNTKNNKELHQSIQQLHQKINTKKLNLTTRPQKKSKKYYGIDISKWNGNLLNDKLPDSIQFVICKATEGLDYVDPKFHFNWKQIRKKNLKRGAYHYYLLDDDPKKQAIHFWNQIKDIQPHDFPPVVDIETGGDDGSTSKLSDIKRIQTDLFIFLHTLEELSNRKPMIYCTYFFANKNLTSKKFGRYPLWVADYEHTSSPIVPSAWKKTGWTIWQKSPSYTIDSKTIDLDIYIEK
ncbi:glycoside hydrolase family 25 protein [Tenacibaculum agarivorans]|uniref:glycoside hydrolase family 25 protein n=1 Tax=Tenacibaculum agarivorans TaxID=1908389 RepID=UPI00094B8AC6|nr:GH25 family lysozyme [Tenacibaculum agarivorans]